MLRHVLVERPKVVKAEKEKPFVPLPSAGLPRLLRKSDSKRQPSNFGGGRSTAKRLRNGECWLWVEGKCPNRACRFKHECALCRDKSHHARGVPQAGAAVTREQCSRSACSGAAASKPMGRLRDGGGVASDADWCFPRAPDSLKQLRRIWLPTY